MFLKEQFRDLAAGTVLRAPDSWVHVANDDGGRGIRDLEWLIHRQQISAAQSERIAGQQLVLLETPQEHEAWVGKLPPSLLFRVAVVPEDAPFIAASHLRLSFNIGPQIYRNTIKAVPEIVRDTDGRVVMKDFGYHTL